MIHFDLELASVVFFVRWILDIYKYMFHRCRNSLRKKQIYLCMCTIIVDTILIIETTKYIAAIYVDGNNINITIKHNHCGQRYLKSYMVFNDTRNEWVQSGYINVIEINIWWYLWKVCLCLHILQISIYILHIFLYIYIFIFILYCIYIFVYTFHISRGCSLMSF